MAKHAHNYQSLTREAIAASENKKKYHDDVPYKSTNDTIYCFLLHINASKLADQGRKFKIELSPTEK